MRRVLLAVVGLGACRGCEPQPPTADAGPGPAPDAERAHEIDPDLPELPDAYRCDRSSSTACFVEIPGGTFRMGAQATDPGAPGHDPRAQAHEGPVHEVTLSPYWIGKQEVTVGQYARCLGLGGCLEEDVSRGDGANLDADGRRNHPMNRVSWRGAARYCAWHAGRLPTEAEWEYAARGADGRVFPWGDEPGCGTGIEVPTGPWRREMRPPPCVNEGTEPSANLRGDSPFGLLGMAGNVWEWTADTYAPDAYARHAAVDPTVAESGGLKVQRGGGWTDEDPAELRSAARAALPADSRLVDVGFRCVWVPPGRR